MPNPDNKPLESQYQPVLSADNFKRLYRLSNEELEKWRKHQKKMERIRGAEKKWVENEEEPYLRELALKLNIPIERREGEMVLDEEQKGKLEIIFLDAKIGKKTQDEFREVVMRPPKHKDEFLEIYEKWLKEYDSLPKEKNRDEFVYEQGNEDIRYALKLVLKQRAEDFIKEKHPDRDKFSLADKAKAIDRFYKSLDLFVRANRKELAELNSLEKKEADAHRQILTAKFMQLIKENGMETVDKADISGLFEQIVGDVEYEAYVQTEWARTYGEMIKMADEIKGGAEITEDQWEMRRQTALEERSNELQEAPSQAQSANTATGAGLANAGAEGEYYTKEKVATRSGVHFETVPGEKDIFTIRYLALEDQAGMFSPVVRIKKNDKNEISFDVEEWQADKESQRNGEPIGAKATRTVGARGMVEAVNRLLLDYVLNKRIPTSQSGGSDETPNDVVKDKVMVHFAERLFSTDKFNISDNPLDGNKVKRFERFMRLILMKDEDIRYNTLLKRVDMMSKMLDRGDMLQVIQVLFKDENRIVPMPFEKFMKYLESETKKKLGNIR